MNGRQRHLLVDTLGVLIALLMTSAGFDDGVAAPPLLGHFTPLEKRWVIERTNAWPGRYRRNSKDYERTIESSTAMVQISHRHLMLNRRSPCDRPAFHYRKDAA